MISIMFKLRAIYKCLFLQYIKTSKNKIYGTHETPKKHYIDDMTYILTDSEKRCLVEVSLA